MPGREWSEECDQECSRISHVVKSVGHQVDGIPNRARNDFTAEHTDRIVKTEIENQRRIKELESKKKLQVVREHNFAFCIEPQAKRKRGHRHD
jgi:hypothetical protein